MAVLNASLQDLEKAEELLVQMEDSVRDPSRFSVLDTAFHTLLVKTTGNRLLIWIVAQISHVRNQDQWARMQHLTLNERMITEYNRHHRQVLYAIRAREPEQAATVMKQHLESARLSLTRAASTRPGSSIGRWRLSRRYTRAAVCSQLIYTRSASFSNSASFLSHDAFRIAGPPAPRADFNAVS